MWVAAKLGSSIAHFFYFIFKLYIIVLVLPNIKMNPQVPIEGVQDTMLWLVSGKERKKMSSTCSKKISDRRKKYLLRGHLCVCVCVCVCMSLKAGHVIKQTHTHAHPNTSKSNGHSCLAFWRLQGVEKKQHEQSHTDLKCTLCSGNVNLVTAEGMSYTAQFSMYTQQLFLEKDKWSNMWMHRVRMEVVNVW